MISNLTRALCCAVAFTGLTGCGAENDPGRFDAIHKVGFEARHKAELKSLPLNVDEMRKALRLSKDSDLQVAQHSDSVGKVYTCFTSKKDDTFMYLESSTGPLYVYYGDGDCSKDADDAEAVWDGLKQKFTKGESLMPKTAAMLRQAGEGEEPNPEPAPEDQP